MVYLVSQGLEVALLIVTTSFEWGVGASYDMYKHMSVYAQYTGQAFFNSSTGASSGTGTFFTAGLEFHTGLL